MVENRGFKPILQWFQMYLQPKHTIGVATQSALAVTVATYDNQTCMADKKTAHFSPKAIVTISNEQDTLFLKS